MATAMLVPAIALVALLPSRASDGEALVHIQHGVMVPCMLAVIGAPGRLRVSSRAQPPSAARAAAVTSAACPALSSGLIGIARWVRATSSVAGSSGPSA